MLRSLRPFSRPTAICTFTHTHFALYISYINIYTHIYTKSHETTLSYIQLVQQTLKTIKTIGMKLSLLTTGPVRHAR
jgi:hypothetical protein